MEEIFAPYLVELTFSEKEIRALERLRDGKRVPKSKLSPKEMNDVGLCYWNGHIVPLDYKKAVRWYKYSASRGYNVAEFNLYVCYDKGTGVNKDPQKALEWLRKAAKQECPNAQDLLAECYYKGEMVKKNRHWTHYWFDKSEKSAVEENDEVTLNSIGMRYLFGICDTPIDIEKAIGYFEKAGELDFPLSMSFLLSIYIGMGNVEKVEYWMNKLRKCKTATKYRLDREEKRFFSFIEEVSECHRDR